jgi:probable HAF family extracellular repeat protein
MPVAVGAGGEVVGNRLASEEDGGDRPFLWTRATGMVDLGIGRGTTAWVNAMTPGLHIAGAIGFADGRQRAMSWTRQTGMRELGTLGGRTSVARAVNARGQIVGFAENAAGAMRAFVWSAGGGLLDLNRSLRHAPSGLVLDQAVAINDRGAIVATSNAGLVLLRPDRGCTCGHTLGPLVAPRAVKVGEALQASVAFVDSDLVGTRSVAWSWGDGTGGAARKLSENGGSGSASADHRYAAPGIYTVTATLVDRQGRSTVVSQDVVVTGPEGPSHAGSAPSST